MKNKRRSKIMALIVTVLTFVLYNGTMFSGTYTVEAADGEKTSTVASPIRISSKEISSGGKISLGSQQFLAAAEGRVLLTWMGNDQLSILCTSSNGTVILYSVENGKETTFQINTGGEYTVAVKNDNSHKISNVNGSIEFYHNTKNQQAKNADTTISSNASSVQSIVYENVEMREYEGKDGHPYIHDTKTNKTVKGITGYQYGMFAFNKDVNPLKIDWWSLGTKAESTYFYLEEIPRQILPNETYKIIIPMNR